MPSMISNLLTLLNPKMGMNLLRNKRGVVLSVFMTCNNMSTTARHATQRLGRAARLLKCHGEEAFKPQFVKESWRKPAISGREAAILRKAAIRDGTYGAFDPQTGRGWDPLWDKPGKVSSIRPPKETKRERTRESRAERIEQLLEQADEKIEAYRKAQLEKKPEPGIENMFKRMTKGPGAK